MSILVKVKAGDKIKTNVFAHYDPTLPDNPQINTQSVTQSIVSGMNSSFAAQFADKGTKLITSASADWFSSIFNFINNNDNTEPESPYVNAHLNWIMLNNENLNLVAEQSGVVPVPIINYGENKVLLQANEGEYMDVLQDGYMYIFVSNGSKKKIKFDDLVIKKVKSAKIDESHYYAFGLKIKEISSDATGDLKNKYKYNGKELQSNEFSDGSGLEWEDYGARMLDVQIGRWGGIDNSTERYYSYSPYNYCLNNPANVVDPDGNDIYLVIWFSRDKDGGETGHAGIAVDNYKTEKYKEKEKYKDPLTRKTKTRTVEKERLVKDGAMSYFDLWPEKQVSTKTELQTNVTDDYNSKTINSLNELLNTDISASGENGEGRAADGVVKIGTTPEQDQAVKKKLTTLQNSGTDYNACSNNCSSFVQGGLQAAFPSFNASQLVKPKWPLSMMYNDANVVAPNNLYNAALQIKNSSSVKGPAKADSRQYLEFFGKHNRN